MRPSLQPGDVVFVLPVRVGRLRRGDLVVVRDPRDPAVETVKRVVGLPGEQVTLRDDYLEIAGVVYEEPYVYHPPTPPACGARPDCGRHEPSPRSHRFGTVPASCVLVLGDNREWSTDSRVYGPVPAELVVGRVAACLRPPRPAPHCAPRPLP